MALTDLIEQELLATLRGDGDPKAVLERYAGSKGPLYAALARATAKATAVFTDARRRLREAEARRLSIEGEVIAAENRAAQADRRVKAAERQASVASSRVAAHQGLLQRVQDLTGAGFDEDALTTLGETLARAAKADETTPAEAVRAFLAAAADFAAIADLKREAREAEGRARAAEADAERRERSAKVRKIAVDWAQWLVRQGVTVQAVGAWRSAAEGLGLSAENLAGTLTAALREFGSLEAACQAKAAERDALGSQVEKLKAANAELQAEHRRIRAALDAVAADGSARVAAAEARAVASIEAVGAQYHASLREAGERMAETIRHFAEVQREAAELEQYVRWARALESRDTEEWRDVEPEAWAAFLWHFGQWVEAVAVNPEVTVPDALRKPIEDQAKYPSLCGPVRVPLLALTAWLAEGLRAVPAAATLALVTANGRGRADGRV